MNKLLSCRVTVRDHFNRTVLCQYTTYGLLTDPRTLKTSEGYTFNAGRRAGFGKTCQLIMRINDRICEITVDRMEEMQSRLDGSK